MPPATMELLRSAADEKVLIMAALRMVAGSARTGEDNEEALSLVSSLPTIVAAY
jgi:hypothetical protein